MKEAIYSEYWRIRKEKKSAFMSCVTFRKQRISKLWNLTHLCLNCSCTALLWVRKHILCLLNSSFWKASHSSQITTKLTSIGGINNLFSTEAQFLSYLIQRLCCYHV